MSCRQKAKNVPSVGPKKELHICAELTQTLRLEREGEGDAALHPTLTVRNAIAELHVSKRTVGVPAFCHCFVDSDLPTIPFCEGVLARLAGSQATPIISLAITSASRDIWIAGARRLIAEACAIGL